MKSLKIYFTQLNMAYQMSNINYFKNIFNEDFIYNESALSEPKENMSIELIKNGCVSFVFQFDKQLDKEYKGGLYPFFNRGESKVFKVCDYIIFSELKGKIYALVIELKKGKDATQPQLNAGVTFSNFVLNTVNRVYGKNFNLTIRKISIREYKRKSKTKIKDIEYDSLNTHMFENKDFRIQAFLK